MSYSFRLQAADKDALKRQVVDKFNEIVGQQAAHVHDRNQAISASHAFIDVLPDNPDRDVVVSVCGSLSGSWANADLISVSGVSLNISASFADRGPAV
jgi:hypothetical protein